MSVRTQVRSDLWRTDSLNPLCGNCKAMNTFLQHFLLDYLLISVHSQIPPPPTLSLYFYIHVYFILFISLDLFHSTLYNLFLSLFQMVLLVSLCCLNVPWLLLCVMKRVLWMKLSRLPTCSHHFTVFKLTSLGLSPVISSRLMIHTRCCPLADVYPPTAAVIKVVTG